MTQSQSPHVFCCLIDLTASARASCVFLLSNLDWFWSSKRQNNCSHISRWTLSGLKQLSFTWFSINHVLVSNLIIRSFEERLFPEALHSLFLSGGMIFISHLLRSVYFFISQSALHYMFGSSQSNLTYKVSVIVKGASLSVKSMFFSLAEKLSFPLPADQHFTYSWL